MQVDEERGRVVVSLMKVCGVDIAAKTALPETDIRSHRSSEDLIGTLCQDLRGTMAHLLVPYLNAVRPGSTDCACIPVKGSHASTRFESFALFCKIRALRPRSQSRFERRQRACFEVEKAKGLHSVSQNRRGRYVVTT
ncbi:hypothetical protein EXIGLDRAFT_357951 [Exidia glandulosa HHB12029]|uniref:Uncharacterized protein n=1 Tax=Exidia glandulosa HHB12029 TaxID=1314781 RepID=A0A165LBA3_EXIGL|nr:hypothetical protein EXIGLDRAFT_357951 [Exidia glandulosa HHB12029]